MYEKIEVFAGWFRVMPVCMYNVGSNYLEGRCEVNFLCTRCCFAGVQRKLNYCEMNYYKNKYHKYKNKIRYSEIKCS